MAALRMTDLDRNLLVASTGSLGLDRVSVRERSRTRVREQRKDKAEIVE